MKIALLLIFLIILIPFANAEIKKDLDPKLAELEKLELKKYKIVLPLTFKIENIGKEEFLIKLNKEGKFEFLEEGKFDVIIAGDEEDLLNVLNSDDKNLKDNITKIQVKGESLKGKIALAIGEKIAKVKFNKNKSFSDKMVGAIVYPITAFIVKN